GAGQVALPPAKFSTTSTSYALGTPPAKRKEYQIDVLDQRTGLEARKTLPAKKEAAAPIQFSASDFNLVRRLQVAVTGAGGKPLASATVALEDVKGKQQSKILDPAAKGGVAFEAVPVGAAKLTVTPTGGGAVTQEIQVD